ncbi:MULTISPECIES: protein transport protein HofC [unclassified Gilliamella]|uniref:protein transport protein HofC n=1 Tax=unclassified Gilliamella TaxID=2685620 RepID=UPI00226A42E2|nr:MULTISPECIES: protein transport protein HofC [unclassified Gilliamella]MCX8597339.1 protein transport protein HofC [Gilliamella sp. B3493]MCX8598965.1 protein transport protein HofC [Gilliamella sp. B3486]MCX8689026.1 protein transport protein HofC [Gilliamella sp. B2973]MCX8704729.1 protein transport protein HofC [Gilliamella sp. B3127]
MKRIYFWYDINFHQNKIIATSKQDVKRQLLLQGQIAIKIRAGNIITKKSFNPSDLLIITKQLATMLKAGLSIIDSLRLILDDQPKPQWQYLLSDISQQIAKGESLSTVLKQYHSVFPALYCEIIAIGELTGQLDHSFEQLTAHLEKSLQLQKQIRKAMRYPLFLLSVSVVVIIVMMFIVLPKFADIYQSFDAQLPYFTQLVIDIANKVQQNGVLILLVPSLGYFLFQRFFKVRYQLTIDRQKLALPLLGQVIQSQCLMQIFHTLAITQQAGIPLITGLSASANTTGNSYYRDIINKIINGIEQGNAFSQMLSSYFPKLCVQLVHAGEESGSLDVMLNNLSLYYQQQNQTLTDNLVKAFEPILMLFLALIIGGLVISMYLPVFQMGDVIH